jgi:hypothetical protein
VCARGRRLGIRLEGKAVPPLEHREDDRTDISQFTEAELTAMLRSRMKTVLVETDEERPEGEPLNDSSIQEDSFMTVSVTETGSTAVRPLWMAYAEIGCEIFQL